MPTIGYGEDGLTFQGLHAQRQELLDKLGDPTPAPECLVYFRPSFGRAGGSQFGEFDAILAARETIYLIEAKWNAGPKTRGQVNLEPVQRTRHEVFQWLYENWCDEVATDDDLTWAEFAAQRGAVFAAQFPSRHLAEPKRLLARNLHAILTELARPRRKLVDVLLYFHPVGLAEEPKIADLPDQASGDHDFRVVTLPYTPIGTSRYFRMADPIL